MIIYLAPGEPSYLPDGLFGPLRDEAFPDLVPVIRSCADHRIQWDILSFLAATTDWISPQDMARCLHSPVADVLEQLKTLTQTGLIQERLLVCGPQYQWRGRRRLRAFFGPWAARNTD